MKQLSGNEIRQMFLDYFKQHGHMVEPGASLVPINDPTLLWINSGVAALKKYFDGSIKPNCNRITNAQKSIRTNDIENVGKTSRHHTFFEMLGNFSIGDYFKEEAIGFAWEFLTSPEWIGFDKDRMYITVHPDDQQAFDIWTMKLGVDPTHILKSYENYWQIGDGPCGPNSEIYYDRGPEYDPTGLSEKLFFEELENDRYIEVWNVVFSQYDGKEGVDRKLYKELPQKNIDTGMGLERLVCLVQNVPTNFDSDLFMPIIKATEQYTEIKYNTTHNMAYRVIADHIRTVTFALADGAMFSNEGRGYVLRRVLRRAVRFGKQLNIHQSFMYQLVGIVAANMSAFYPYVTEKVEYIAKLVKLEEDRFHNTLADGEQMLNNLMNNSVNKMLDGESVFKLYDTYGFPFELTKEIALENGYTVDEPGFKDYMEQQRQRARNSRENVESMTSQSPDLMNFNHASSFIGYDHLECEATVIGLFVQGVTADVLIDEGDLIVDETVFYAESGGQIADTGTISNDKLKAFVTDVKKAPFKQHLHHVKITEGSIKVGDKVKLQIDVARRLQITKHHSAAHLLQAALHALVSNNIAQAGSYVADQYLRFDFTHFEKVSKEQQQQLENWINHAIADSLSVNISSSTLAQAKEDGVTALFDEKYGETVRVVKMGGVSAELCGGCHVKNTSEIGMFKILSEESIGSGIRRITAVVSLAAYAYYCEQEALLERLAGRLKVANTNLLEDKVNQLIHEKALIEHQLSDYQQQFVAQVAQDTAKLVTQIDGLNTLFAPAPDTISDLKQFTELLSKLVDGVVFTYQVTDKISISSACNPLAIQKGYKAGDLVKFAAAVCQGNGGGRPDFAQAGGRDITKVDEMVKAVKAKLQLDL